jgi:uncharacterized protein (DUF433 family)
MTVLPIDYIVSTPGVCGGRPRINNHRVTVENIAVLHNSGWSAETVVRELNLTLAEVYAALSYYYGHKDFIDQLIRDADELALRTGRSLKELVGDLDEDDIQADNVVEFFRPKANRRDSNPKVQYDGSPDQTSIEDIVVGQFSGRAS